MSKIDLIPNVINAIAECETQAEKLSILAKYEKENLLRRIIKIAYNPWVNLKMQNFVPKHSGKEFGMGITKFIHIIDDVIEGKLDQREAEFACRMAFIHIGTENAPVFLMMINQTLDTHMGLEIDTINSVWNNLIVKHPCRKPSTNVNVETFNKFPAAIQSYSEGLRINVIVNEQTVEYRLTSGKTVEGWECWNEQFINLAQGQNTVFDGHAVVVDVESNNIAEVDNDAVLTAPADKIRFVLWDVIRYDGFINGRDTRIGYNWRYNGIEHMMLLAMDKNQNPCYDIARAELVGSQEQLLATIKIKGRCVIKSLAGIWEHGTTDEEIVYNPSVSV